MDKITRIKQTKEYDQFKFITGNRGIGSANLTKLIRSIREKDMLSINPIIVNENMEIIDGQHRLEAAKALEVPIYYIVQGETGVDEVIMLNTVSKNWGMLDFAKSYANLGQEDYKRVLDLNEKFGVSVSVILSIAGGKKYIDQRATSHSFKSGLFTMSPIEEMYVANTCHNLQKFKPHFPRWKSSHFVGAMLTLFKDPYFKTDRFLSKLDSGIKLHIQDNKAAYLRAIEEIYNHGISDERRIRFY